jgi:hypothetical protein
VVAAADPGLPAYLQALLADEVKVSGGKAYVVRDGKAPTRPRARQPSCPTMPRTWSTTTACAANWKRRWPR